MKRNDKLAILLGALLCAVVIVGCKNLSTQVFRTEQAITDVATAANEGYHAALANGTIKVSVQESNAVKEARTKVAASLTTVEQWRVAYETNSAVKPQLQSALDALVSDNSNFVYLVNLLKNKQP